MIIDPTFGPVLLLGLGGRWAALFDEVIAVLPPLNLALAREAIAQAPGFTNSCKAPTPP